MDDQGKTCEQLVAELAQLRQQVTELEAAQVACKQTQAGLSASEKKYRELYESALDARRRDLDDRKRAEQFLRASEERYRRIVETAHEGIWIIDASGKTTFVNQRMADMLGCMIGEMLYAPLYAFMDERDYALVSNLLERRRQGIAEQREFRFRRRDGTLLWVILELTSILDERRQYAGALMMVTDITDRRRAEETLRESEELHRVTMEHILDPVFITEDNGAFTFICANVPHILGYTVQELEAMGNITGLVGDHLFDLEELKRLGQISNIERVIADKRGRERVFLVTVRRVSIKGGTLLYVCHDITERKQAEEALRESHQLLERTFSSLHDAVFVLNEKTVVLNCNPAASQIFGYPQNEILGRTTAFLHVDAATLAEFRRQLDSAIETRGALEQFEFRMKRKDGTIFLTEHSVLPITDALGMQSGWVSVVRDITERKRAEESLREAEARYRSLFENSVMGISQALPDGSLVCVNAAYAHTYGYADPEEMMAEVTDIGRQIYAHPEEREEVLHILKEKGVMEPREIEVVRRDGSRFFVLVGAREIRDAKGNLVCYQAEHIDITDRKQTEERIQREAARAQALARIAARLNAQLDLDAVLSAVCDESAQALNVPVACVSLYQPESQAFIPAAVCGLPPQALQEIAPLSRVLYQALFGPLVPPVVVPDLLAVPDWINAEFYARYDLRAVAAVGLVRADDLIGVLSIHTVGQPRAFDADELDLLKALADQAAQAIANARLLQETRQHGERLALLNRIARVCTATLDLNELLEIIQQEITAAMEADASFIALYDRAASELDYRIRMDKGVRAPPERRPLTTSLTSSIVASKQPVLIRDFEREKEHLPPVNVWGTLEMPASWLGAPISLGENVIGVISVQAYRPNAYGQAELELLGAIADRVAVAIENARLYEAVRTGQEQLRDLAEYLQSAREQERATIAREIHDEFGQALTALKMDLSWLSRRLPPGSPDLLDKVNVMSQLVDGAIHTVRRIATELRPGLLDDLGLAAAIEWQVHEFAGRTGLACELRLGDHDLALDPDLATALFRILQEALTNIARHARATRVAVELNDQPGLLTLVVRDDGKGIEPEQVFDSHSLGLIGMRERARAWNGDVVVEGCPGAGTTVTARIPTPAQVAHLHKGEAGPR